METVTAFASRRPESAAPLAPAPTSEAERTLSVAVTYLLSEDGRKASLMGGGNGRALQQLTIDVSANRLHLVGVDNDGIARLKLRPRYEQDESRKVVRIDAIPTYDAPPSIDDLFREAARNHQLERAYVAERQAERSRRRDADHDRRAEVARAFLADQAQRALPHPTPTPTRCVLMTSRGRVSFDAARDDTPARDVPAEAHRRFRTDLRTRREESQRTRAADLAAHEEKQRVADAWIAQHGSAEQRARQVAGVLPLSEVIETIADVAFAPLGARPRFVPDGLERLREAVAKSEWRGTDIARHEAIVSSTSLQQMTAAQWAMVNEIQRLLPTTTVTMRVHRISWKRNPSVVADPYYTVVVVLRQPPFTLRREFVA